ncbi:MAG: hypothetical protein QXZ66_03385 [Thermoproteota archaeon]
MRARLEDVPTMWIVKSTLFYTHIHGSIDSIYYMVCEDTNGNINVETSG